ncbi:gamma-secretase-activating protein isoform X2 [Leucoraja erinacea]|uniref:gamma-secretase-activating protein isoform X2 n=1 Tax=Leucoraja erinaceus TaxID=7782 RepID=UPI0024558BD3|nr:gamma-secretase-activating protein isoform X2 [Leucoraja erinacea]
MLELESVFDTQSEVVPWLVKGKLTPLNENGESTNLSRTDLQIINVEKNGGVVFTWKGKKGTTCVGLHDLHKKQNKLLYIFDREVSLISCSVNKERTLLAVSILQFAGRDMPLNTFRPVSRCLTLLIEIHPANNTKVLKAIDSNVKVQFLYQDSDARMLPESHLLIISEDRCIEHIRIRVIIEEGYRAVIQDPDHLPKEIVAEDFFWAQWDTEAQRLFYIVEKESNAVLMCYQFYLDRSNEMLMSLSLGFPLIVTRLSLVNFGYNYFHEEEKSSESLNLQIFTDHAGALSVCYSHPMQNDQEFIYSVILLHYGWRKTFRVSLEKSKCASISDLAFLNVGYYIAVYVPGYFLHLINIQHPNLTCHSLFLSGDDAKVKPWNHQCYALSSDLVLDCHLRKIYKPVLNPQLLMQFMRNSKLVCHQRAAIHCAILYLQCNSVMESQIIHWLCGLSASACADLIQEFIVGTIYRKAISETNALAKLLPCSSLVNWKGDIPGITCTTENILQSAGKRIHDCKVFWEVMNTNVESLKNFECLHKSLDTNSLGRMKSRLLSGMKADARAIRHFTNVLETAKMILSKVDTLSPEERVVPFCQEEDCQQMALIGLMSEKLKEHVLKHAHSLGKKKIDVIVNNYVANLLECIWKIVDTIWKNYGLRTHNLCLSNREEVNSAEFVVFHMMIWVLQAVEGLSLPLPPGYHTIHMVLGARCLPLHSLLHYIDLGLLHPTEQFVTRLIEELDNSEINERFKLSIMARIPKIIEQKICCLWDHPISTSHVARNYVEILLKKRSTQQKSRPIFIRERDTFETEFLPLTYLARILTEVEYEALNPFEAQQNVDVKFVEEVALKQTFILLGLENK